MTRLIRLTELCQLASSPLLMSMSMTIFLTSVVEVDRYVCTCVYVWVCLRLCECMYDCMCVCVYVCVHDCMCSTCIYAWYVHTYLLFPSENIYIYIYIYMVDVTYQIDTCVSFAFIWLQERDISCLQAWYILHMHIRTRPCHVNTYHSLFTCTYVCV